MMYIMKTLLEQLYDGEIYPAEQIICVSADYKPTHLEIDKESEYLKQKLSTEDAARIDRLEDLFLKSSSLTSYASFAHGFKLGARLMCEAYTEVKKQPYFKD